MNIRQFLMGMVIACSMAASGAQAQATGSAWAWAAGKITNNGSVQLKSSKGTSTFNAVQNPTGTLVKSNQSALTQPPAVLITAGGKAYRSNGAPCVYPYLSPGDGFTVYLESDHSKQMKCWTDWPYAGTWRADGTTIPCFVGLPEDLVTTYCTIGGAVQASKDDSTAIGLYAGQPQCGMSYCIIAPGKHLIVDLVDRPKEYWGCWNQKNEKALDDWNGKQNTQDIREMMQAYSLCWSGQSWGESSRSSWGSAAMLCLERYDPDRTRNGPWFLPSNNQMEMMRANTALFIKAGFQDGQKYWTSEKDRMGRLEYAQAWFMTTAVRPFGYQDAGYRMSDMLLSRCVRNFN